MIPLPPGPATLDEMIAAAARRHPDRTAIATMDASVTYAQLRDLVASLAAHMHRSGIGRGARVALNIDHPLVAVALTLACARIGAAWAPATPQVGASAALGITHLLYDGAARADPPANYLHVTPDWSRPPPGRPAPLEGYASPSDPWMITQSSGTTGTPKLMGLDEAMCCQRANPAINPHTPMEIVCAVLFPPLSLPGLTRSLCVLAGAGTVVFAELTEIFGHVRLDCAVGSPNHYRRLLERAPPVARRAGLAVFGGAPASRELIARTLRYFEGVSITYASSEAWIACTNTITDARNLPERISVGRPLPHVDLQIVDTEGRELPQGQEGIIRLRHPCQVSAYIGDPRLSAEVFRDGWFHPGDLGYLTEAGELVVTGRAGEQLNIGGEKVNPDVIDAAMLAVPGIKDAACFSRADANGVDRLEAAIAIAGPLLPPAILAALAQHLRARFEAAHIPYRVHIVPELPRTPTGKIPRHQLAAAVAGARSHYLPGAG